ncbi:unnamed protein product [Paramecium octaurelia]|uniref:Uncharacterized protein n=1 Tax=Paramecium octaurelia TaxID=43137 RepID=A0A8S1S979_PAROT|nr:unnamed protein product [Paramecium octaurelia]
MNLINNFCKNHSNVSFCGVLRARPNFKFPTKVCIECIQQFNIPQDQVLEKENLVEKLFQKSSQHNLVEKIGQTECKQIFIEFLDKLDAIQEQIALLISKMREYINMISKTCKMEDERFLKLNQYNQNLLECSPLELDFLIRFLDGNIFEEWIQTKQQAISQTKKVIHTIERQTLNIGKINHLLELISKNLGFKESQRSIRENQFKNDNINDGEIIRKYQYKEFQENEVVLNNLEQIKYLNFRESPELYGQNFKQWNIYWKQEQVGGGVCNQQGQKDGKWIDISNNFWDGKNAFEVGHYDKDTRIGHWKFIFRNQIIGGGLYEGQGLKTGRWIELSDGFHEKSQIIFSGQYENGNKVGKWDIEYRFNDIMPFQQIGGGIYEYGKANIKKGKWVELNDRFQEYSQVTYKGEYHQNKKIGNWEIWYKDYNSQIDQKIGGGEYDQQVGGMKIGKWIELSDRFSCDSQVTYIGEYKGSNKVGKWDTYFRYNYSTPLQKIAGGYYDQGSNGIKIGKWIELSERFWKDQQVISIGEYNNGQKVGRWDIKYEGNQIGGGIYKEGDADIKNGEWIELSEDFETCSQVTYVGKYQNGKKIGRWDIWFTDYISKNKQLIGGGSYDIEFGGIKIGKWVALCDNFRYDSQVTYCGEYKHGKKVNKWDILYKDYGMINFQELGGGQYDGEGNGLKTGSWVELSEEFNNDSQVYFSGEYKNGYKVGRWDIWYRDDRTKLNNQIGGGTYDEIGNGFKIGQWIEQGNKYSRDSQIIIYGEYKFGKRYGKQIIQHQGNQIGGGMFDEEANGFKIGQWIEIAKYFNNLSQIIYKGEYENGNKVGEWVEVNLSKLEKIQESHQEH